MARSLAIDQMLASRARRSFHPSILEDHRERRASAVRERIRSALAIVPDKSPDSHRLHRLREDPDRGVVNASRGAKQDHAILGTELRRCLCHGTHPAASFARLRAIAGQRASVQMKSKFTAREETIGY